MGVDYSAAIMVGLEQCNVDYDDGIYDDLNHFLEEHGMEICAAYYDGDSDDDAIAGYMYNSSGDYQASEFEWDQKEIDELKKKFKKITGLDAKVWLSTEGS